MINVYLFQINFNFATCKGKGKSHNLFIEKNLQQEHGFTKSIKAFYFRHV